MFICLFNFDSVTALHSSKSINIHLFTFLMRVATQLFSRDRMDPVTDVIQVENCKVPKIEPAIIWLVIRQDDHSAKEAINYNNYYFLFQNMRIYQSWNYYGRAYLFLQTGVMFERN